MANKAKLELIASMFIFGTIGIFVRHIPLPSSMIALVRGFVGAFFVLLFVYLKKSKLDKEAIKNVDSYIAGIVGYVDGNLTTFEPVLSVSGPCWQVDMIESAFLKISDYYNIKKYMKK